MTTVGSDNDIWMKVYCRAKNIVSRRIAGELFLVPVSGNLADMQNMFALTPVADFIWERLDSQKSLRDIRDDVLSQFDAEQKEIETDIKEFVAELIAAGLVHEVSD